MKDVPFSTGYPYAQNAAATTTCAYSSTIHLRFLYDPHAQIIVLGWHLFIAAHGTNISHAGKRGAGAVTFLQSHYRVPHVAVHKVNPEDGVH